MGANAEPRAARRYHQDTRHSYESVHRSRHFLDWPNQPLPFKIYTGLEALPLPRELGPSSGTALEALAADGRGEAALDLQGIARLAHFSAGVTRVRRYPGGEILFRAAACTGALYHVELYFASGDIPGLPAGLYHFSPQDHALRQLRRGDWRSALIEAAGGEPAVAAARAIAVLTSTYWRNSWKYQARAYRHVYWDSGTLLANFLAVAAASGLAARLVLGFVDQTVNRLLGVDPDKEVAVALVALGTDGAPAESAKSVSPIDHATQPLSAAEVDYPEIREMHAASRLESPEEVVAWRGSPPPSAERPAAGRLVPIEGEPNLPADPIESVARRRGSSRRFATRPIRYSELSALLERATRGIPADFLEPYGACLTVPYLVVNRVEGLPSGAYAYRRVERGFELIREGDFHRQAGYLALEQELGADAAVNVYFLCDLQPVLARFGNRGYRAAQLEGGIRGGKLYLAAYALGLGATGLTFYDDEVTEFFSPPAAGKSVMFLCALGHPARRRALRDEG